MPIMMSRIKSLCSNLLGRTRVEADLNAELQSSLQLLVDEKVSGGMTLAEARRSARLELGGLEQIKEGVRDVKRGLGFESVWQDVRFGLRSLKRSPIPTFIAILSLSIGIGVNASLFSLLHRLVLPTLPVHEAHRLFIIYSNNRTGVSDSMSFPDIEMIRTSTELFDGVLGVT